MINDCGKNTPAPRGSYIPAALERHCLNGDAFIMATEAYAICTGGRVPYQVFECDLAQQRRMGTVFQEGDRLYLTRTWRCENAAAVCLADIIRHNEADCPEYLDNLMNRDEMRFNGEQCNAVKMALSHRLSVVLGGAGTGKTTLIKKIVEEQPGEDCVLTAPTGKAARNLEDRTGYQARTIHSALGLRHDDDALSPVIWERVDLVVVDEASMVTIELLAGLLCKVSKDCRIVLVGDPNQLLAVGSGNVLPDLLELGIPYVRLSHNFRQVDRGTALYHNVVRFDGIQNEEQLSYDAGFRLEQLDEAEAGKALVKEAVRRYEAGERVQVLSPYNSKTHLSVCALNHALQEQLNPAAPRKKELLINETVFRDGDRVIITRNDPKRECVNGDIGVIRIDDDNAYAPLYHVVLENGRILKWGGWNGLSCISLSYALTVHKAQGSQYDTVLFPVVQRFSGMLYRNLLYTSISRAKKRVILYGCRNALSVALQTKAKPRRSMLVPKTRMMLLKKVG